MGYRFRRWPLLCWQRHPSRRRFPRVAPHVGIAFFGQHLRCLDGVQPIERPNFRNRLPFQHLSNRITAVIEGPLRACVSIPCRCRRCAAGNAVLCRLVLAEPAAGPKRQLHGQDDRSHPLRRQMAGKGGNRHDDSHYCSAGGIGRCSHRANPAATQCDRRGALARHSRSKTQTASPSPPQAREDRSADALRGKSGAVLAVRVVVT
jgi:hypothetical protein